MTAKKRAPRKKKEEVIPLLTVRGMRKFLFGSKSRGGVTILMICGTIVAVSRAAPIAWDWTMTGRSIGEKIMTIDIQKDIGKMRITVSTVRTDMNRIDHEHSTKMDSMLREMQIQREMGHRSWALLRDFAGMTAPPDPESLVPTPVPTPTRLAERFTE